MNDLVQTASDLQTFLEDRKWQFCFIGGLAVVHWGEPRLTRDVDVTLLAEYSNESRFVEPLLDNYEARIEDAREFALENRVILLRSGSGIPIDIALGAVPFEEEATRDAVAVEFIRGVNLRLCLPEDLIVMKAFADREEDWRDISGIIVKQEGQLDSERILRNLEPFVEVKGNLEALRRVESLLGDEGRI